MRLRPPCLAVDGVVHVGGAMEYLVVVHRDRPGGPCGGNGPGSAGVLLGRRHAGGSTGQRARGDCALRGGRVGRPAEPVPEPSSEVDADGGIVAAVPLDDGLLSEKAIRVSVTLPSRLLTLIDRAPPARAAGPACWRRRSSHISGVRKGR